MITNIQRFSINDGPGIRTTVFIKGCDLRCHWCHNPETQECHPEIYFREAVCRRKDCGRCVDVCPIGAIDLEKKHIIHQKKCNFCMKCIKVCPFKALIQVGRLVSAKEVLKELKRDYLFYQNSGGGITISGGDPLVQPLFVKNLLLLCKQNSIHSAIDTAGNATHEVMLELANLTDLILYDIKHINSKKHILSTRVSNELILENVKILADHGMNSKIRIRVPIIPDFNDSEKDIHEIASFTKSLGIDWVDLLPYHRYGESKYKMLGRNYKLKGVLELSREKVLLLESIFKDYSIKTTIES